MVTKYVLNFGNVVELAWPFGQLTPFAMYRLGIYKFILEKPTIPLYYKLNKLDRENLNTTKLYVGLNRQNLMRNYCTPVCYVTTNCVRASRSINKMHESHRYSDDPS